MPLLLKNATYVDYDANSFINAHIRVEEDASLPLTFFDINMPLDLDACTVIDCSGKYVLPSFACGHHHAYSALARGMGGPLKPTANFHDNLKYLWWALDKSLDKTSVRASALATAIACAKNGVTFVIDHHASPFYTDGVLELIAEAFEEIGVGHLLCYEISDRDGNDIALNGLQTTENYLKHHQGLVGLHASFTVGDDTLKAAVVLAEKYNSGIHIHTAEDICDQEACLQQHSMRVVERLSKAGVLNFPKSILVHCLHLSEHERELIANSPVYVAQNVESNLNNNVGFFNGKGLNNNIMLGTDGMHSNMLRSLKAAYITGQTTEQLPMDEAFKRFVNPWNYLKANNFGGHGAHNLLVLDYKSPTPLTPANFLGHLIFGIESSDILHVISRAKLIIKDRMVVNVDEDEVAFYTQKAASALWHIFKSQKV